MFYEHATWLIVGTNSCNFQLLFSFNVGEVFWKCLVWIIWGKREERVSVSGMCYLSDKWFVIEWSICTTCSNYNWFISLVWLGLNYRLFHFSDRDRLIPFVITATVHLSGIWSIYITWSRMIDLLLSDHSNSIFINKSIV